MKAYSFIAAILLVVGADSHSLNAATVSDCRAVLLGRVSETEIVTFEMLRSHDPAVVERSFALLITQGRKLYRKISPSFKEVNFQFDPSVDDYVQDAVLSVYLQALKKDPEDRIRSVFSYLGKTIYMRLLKDYPKSKMTVQLHERAEAYLQQPSRVPFFINLQYKSEVLKAALARVNPKFLPALKLSLEDKPYKDIAGQLGISIDLVKTRIFRARLQFRKALLKELKKSNPARD